jgi:hypothetical protein
MKELEEIYTGSNWCDIREFYKKLFKPFQFMLHHTVLITILLHFWVHLQHNSPDVTGTKEFKKKVEYTEIDPASNSLFTSSLQFL